MVGGRHEEEIHCLGDLEVVSRHRHGTKGRDPPLSGAAHEAVERAPARVERIDHAIRLDRVAEAEGEVAGTGSEIAYQHAGSNTENANDGVGIAKPILTRTAAV